MSNNFFFPRILFVVESLLLVFSATIAFGATQLPDAEGKALVDIAKTLGKTNWNFSADPCGGDYGWANPKPVKGFEDAVTCNCYLPNSTFCHVTSIVLKSQSLPGKLPPELNRLPHLQEIDLTRNYLYGTIPREWASLPLFPGWKPSHWLHPYGSCNIITLKSFVIDFNSFSGVLPPKLGDLPNIEKMFLTSNNFTGELPETFAKLITLTDFRISDNSFLGRYLILFRIGQILRDL
ncbi:hypothetical protein M0R45_014560 [Rubus argutus]|uniref:Uncharacterized protein n=1 Tax=Rubus argutus TaxID=59490 RepID=A0AAW1XMZ4_RUBAR